jgi:SAM-dependent methyltransferase
MSLLSRILEIEVMDTAEDAREYNSMDHTAVNELFVMDLIDALTDWSPASTKLSPGKRPVRSDASRLNILDLGAGTAQIPIDLARRTSNIHIIALDAAESMLALARENISAAGLSDQITTSLADAKQLPFEAGTFPVVISNSILHHVPHPRDVLAEAIRVTEPGGLLFHRDLCRPDDEDELNYIVETYAAEANPYQRRLFTDSLHAALTLEEVQRLVADFGYVLGTVRKTSDRHWTWVARSSGCA